MNKRLDLARAAIPSVPWQYDEQHGLVYDPRDGTQFDPENNESQAWDVLAWLSRNTCIDWHKPDCNAIGGEHQIVLCDFDGATFDHDGTSPGIRRAVVRAAERCV